MRTRIGGAVVVTALAATLSAAASPRVGPRTFGTRGEIRVIAADGTHVAAFAERVGKRCAAVVVFDATSARFDRYDLKSACPGSDVGAFGPDIVELAVAGSHAAWLESGGGNEQELQLHGATLGRKGSYELEFVANGHGAEESYSGDWVSGVRGQGGVLVYALYSICEVDYELADCFEEEPTPGFDTWQVGSPRLVKAAGKQKRAIRKEIGSLLPVAVDDGLIALAPLHEKDPVLIVDGAGAVKAKVPVPLAPSIGLAAFVEHPPYALDGGTLYVLRARALEAYAIATGKLTKKTALPAAASGATLVGVAGGFAGLRIRGAAYAVRLSNGKATRIEAPKGARKPGIVDASLTGAGLFYAYNVPSTTSHGRVSFLPLAKLTARF